MSASTYISVAEEINNLRVHSIPSKPIKGASVIRVDRTYVIVDKAGKVYSSQVTGNYAYTPGHSSGGLRNTIDGACRLGVISKAAMEKDKAHRAASESEQQRKHQARVLLISASELGVKLTAAQLRRIGAIQTKKGGA